MDIIKITNLNYKFKNKEVLKNVNFSIEKNSFTSILGPNGSGKSTLAFIIAGLSEEENLGVEINSKDNKRNVGLILENPDNQIIGTCVKDDIAFGLQNLLLSKKEIDKKIDWVLNELDMIDLKDRGVTTLSGGQKQKLAIASLLVLDYDIYVFDEATSMLDHESRKDFFKLIDNLLKLGKTIIQITHFIDEVKWSKNSIVLNEGKVVFDGKSKDLLKMNDFLEENNLIGKW